MSDGIVFLLKVDQAALARLNENLRQTIAWSEKRSPALCVNSCAYAVVQRTIDLTPHVPIERMDTEIGTAVVLQPKMRGKGFLRSAKTRRYTGGKTVQLRDGRVVSLAFMVQIARANLTTQGRATGQSNYNQRTNNRWAIRAGDLRNSAIPAMMSRMIAARHSSSKFLIAGWVAAKRDLRRGNFAEPVTIDADTGQVLQDDFGRSMPAREGSAVAICVVENMVGMGNSRNAQNYNQALHEHGIGPLNRAISEEAESHFVRVFNKIFAAEMVPMWR